MSLGLFTKDANGDVWFDVDCIDVVNLAQPHPKHFVFNLGNANDRVLLLYTGFTQYPTVVGHRLVGGNNVTAQQIVDELKTVLNAAVLAWNDPNDIGGFLRIIYWNGDDWAYDAIDWEVRGRTIAVVPTVMNEPIHVNSLYCLGVGEVHAQNDWLTTGVLPMEDRLRSALQAAHDNGAQVRIPSVRRPAKLSDCILSFAAENQLLT